MMGTGAERQPEARDVCAGHGPLVEALTTVRAQIAMVSDRQAEQAEALERVPGRTVELIAQMGMGVGQGRQHQQAAAAHPPQGDPAAAASWPRTIGAAVAGALAWAAGAGLIPAGQAQQSQQGPQPKPPAVEAPKAP